MPWVSLILSFLLLVAVAAWLAERGCRKRLRAAQFIAAKLLGEHGAEISEALYRASGHDIVDDLELLRTRQEQLGQAVVHAQAKLETTLRGIVEGLMVVDAKRVIQLVNPRFLEFFRLADVPVNRTILETIREAEVELMVRSTLATGASQRREIVVSGLVNGTSSQTFEVNSVATQNEDGVIDGAVVSFHDISRLKQLEQVRRDFVANVSHELRTPLSIFRGYLETLLDDPKQAPKELLRVLHIMEKHSNRLNLLVEDLLSLARLESHAPQLDLAPLKLEPFFQQMIEAWKLKLQLRKLNVTTAVEPPDISIFADEARLEEVLHNLLDNAVKYSPPDGKILLSSARTDSHITIRVADAGAGIPAADLPHIFERFYRVEKSRTRERGGTGLGLSIVKHIVQLHGGNVTAESRVGEGTTVVVSLPIRPGCEALAVHARRQSRSPGWIPLPNECAPEFTVTRT